MLIVTKLGNVVGEHVKIKHFREHLLLDGMLSNLATMFANNSTQSANNGTRNMRKSLVRIATSTSLASKWSLNQRRKG